MAGVTAQVRDRWVSHMLGIDLSEGVAAPSGECSDAARYWDALRESVAYDIARLRRTLERIYADSGDGDDIVAQYLDRAATLTDHLDGGLSDALRAVDAAPAPQRDAARAGARQQVDRYDRFFTGDDTLDILRDNGLVDFDRIDEVPHFVAALKTIIG